MPSSCSVRQRYDALATTMIPAALLAPTSSPSYPTSTSSNLPGISQSHRHGHYSWDSVAEIVATATSATMPNVVRDDWRRGRAMVRLRISFLPIGCQPFSVVVFFLLASISSTRWMRRIPEVYIHLLGVQFLVSLSDSLAGYTFPLYQTTTLEPMRAPRPLDPTHCLKLSQCAGVRTMRVRQKAGWPALLAALPMFLTTSLSDSIFSDVLGALWTRPGYRDYPPSHVSRDAFLTAFAKATLPPPVVAVLDGLQQICL
jgi:hypothetical protein